MKISTTIIERKEIKYIKYTIAGGARLNCEQKLKSINSFLKKQEWKEKRKIR